MIYLIKFIFFAFISINTSANSTQINEILFKINNKVFTNIDLEKRIEYIALINNLNPFEISKTENKEIYDDYVSSLIFYEFYIQNKIIYKNIDKEIELTYKEKFKDFENFNKSQIQNFKSNINIDLIRKKIIEEKLNLTKENLLKETNKKDLLYNYNLQHIIVKENLINKKLIENIDDRKKFNDFKKILKENEIVFFYKEKDINDNTIISNKIKNLINKNTQIDINIKNNYINLISIKKNLESYEGIYVKLINFKTNKPIEEQDLKCNKLKETINTNKTVFKKYEYSKLNNNIKSNLKSINDYILFNEDNNYNYIVLCELTYDEKLLKNINFNKNVNILVDKIQKNFLKKYQNEYEFIKIK